MDDYWIGSAQQSQMIANQAFQEQRFQALEERMKNLERLILDRNANAAEPTPDRRGDVQQLLDMRRFLERLVQEDLSDWSANQLREGARKALGK